MRSAQTNTPRRSLFAGRSDLRQRRYFPLPAWNEQAEAVRTEAAAAAQAWADIRSGRRLAPSSPQAAPHALVHLYQPTPPCEPLSVRLGREEAAFEAFRAAYVDAVRTRESEAFTGFLESLVSRLADRPMRLRTRPILTTPDPGGVRVLFPRPGTLRSRLSHLHGYLRAHEGPAVFRACVAMVAITNSHPFLDGNGRLSRVLASLVLNEDAGDAVHYLALAELGDRPPGNLTLHARDAELNGAWAELLRLFGAAMAASTPSVAVRSS